MSSEVDNVIEFKPYLEKRRVEESDEHFERIRSGFMMDLE